MLKYIIKIIIIVILISCSNDDYIELNYINFDLSAEKVISDNTDTDDRFISMFTISTDGQIYYSDRYSSRISLVNTEGIIMSEVGGPGGGPGEFGAESFINLELIEDEVHAHDMMNMRVNIYDMDLKYQKTEQFEHFQFGEIVKGDYRIVHKHSTDPQSILKLYKGDERVDIEFPIDHDPYVASMNLMHIGFLDDFNFYVAYWFRNLIKVINLDGEVVRTMNVPEWPEESEMKTVQMPDEMMIKSVTATDHGEILVLGSGYTENKHQDIHLFDSEGKYKHTIVLPEPTSMIKYHDRKIYTTSDDQTNIVAYTYPEKIISG